MHWGMVSSKRRSRSWLWRSDLWRASWSFRISVEFIVPSLGRTDPPTGRSLLRAGRHGLRPRAERVRHMARTLYGQPVNVGAPEETPSPDGPHPRQPAVVGQNTDRVRRKAENARGVARREQVIGIEQHGGHLRFPGNSIRAANMAIKHPPVGRKRRGG